VVSEPETWIGNVERACRCEDSPALWKEPPRAGCLGCGLPLPHAAGECKRGRK
jgi:hypothetical protein